MFNINMCYRLAPVLVSSLHNKLLKAGDSDIEKMSRNMLIKVQFVSIYLINVLRLKCRFGSPIQWM